MAEYEFKHLRVFYAHPTGESPGEIPKSVKALKTLIETKLKEKFESLAAAPVIVVTPGRTDHASFFKGDWEKWQEDVVRRRHALTGEPRYSVFVVPGESCGRATAGILQFAMTKGRKVLRWDRKENKLRPVKKVVAFDSEDWISGFMVT